MGWSPKRHGPPRPPLLAAALAKSDDRTGGGGVENPKKDDVICEPRLTLTSGRETGTIIVPFPRERNKSIPWFFPTIKLNGPIKSLGIGDSPRIEN